MPRVIKMSSKGVSVSVKLRNFTGQPIAKQNVTISLPVVCTWRGKIMAVRQSVVTDANGKAHFYLPPTKELVPTGKFRGELEYLITVGGIGSFAFDVPANTATMTIGGVPE